MKKIKRGLSSIFNSPDLLFMGDLILASIGITTILISIFLLLTHFLTILGILTAISIAVKWTINGLFFILGILGALSTIVAIYHAIKVSAIWMYHKIKGE